MHPADTGKAQGSIPWSCIGELCQGNSIAVLNAKTSGRTASSGATEPGVVGHASRKNGRRQNAGWFTARSLPQSRERGSVNRVEGYWRDRAAMCPTFNRGDQGSTPCASIGSPDLARALLVQRISTPRYERGDMGSSPVEGMGSLYVGGPRAGLKSRKTRFDSERSHVLLVARSTSGLCRLPFKEEIASSNLAHATCAGVG